jgi:hypothetical protein
MHDIKPEQPDELLRPGSRDYRTWLVLVSLPKGKRSEGWRAIGLANKSGKALAWLGRLAYDFAKTRTGTFKSND